MFGPNSEYISAVSLYLLELTRSAQEKKTPVFSEKRIMHCPFPSKGNCICISVTKLSKVKEEYYAYQNSQHLKTFGIIKIRGGQFSCIAGSWGRYFVHSLTSKMGNMTS